MKTSTVAIVGLAGLSLLGFAHARSKQKCRIRRAALRRAYPGKTDAELRAISKELNIVYPDCDGFVLFREGV